MARVTGAKSREFPAHTLEKTLVIIQAIVESGAGRPMDRLLVADAIGRTPSSSEFKRLLSSSRWYGLTTGTEKADFITPTELGLKIGKPESPTESVLGLVEASLVPDLMRKVYEHFNKSRLPEPAFLKNTLEKSFAVEPSHSEELAGLIVENAKFCGILQDISGQGYIRLGDPLPQQTEERAPVTLEEDTVDKVEPTNVPTIDGRTEPDNPLSSEVSSEQQRPGQLFVAHGKNLQPLEDLKKILDSFGIAYKVAIDEPNAGRPISAKVAGLMNQCSAGIFIFTKDECFLRGTEGGEAEEIWKPSENVIYELGAAGILWDQKIIILREDGVSFPSDFSDLGYITFKDGEIGAKAMDVMKELVVFKLLKVQAAE